VSDHPIDLLQHRLADPAQREALIRDWLRDRLPPPVAEAFEERLIEDPALADDVELAKTLGESLRETRGPSTDGQRPADATRADPRGTGALAIAATLALSVAAGWMGGRVTAPGASPTPVGSPDRYVFDELRGNDTAPRVIAGRPEADYVIADFAVPEGAESVELRIGGRTAIALQRSSEGFATALIPRDLLQPGVTLELRASVEGVPWSRSHSWSSPKLGG